MRGIIIIALIVIFLAIIGWISFDFGGERPGVNLETPKIERDIETVKETLKQAGDKVEEKVDDSSKTDSRDGTN